MPIRPTDFQNPNHHFSNYDNIEFEPLIPDDPDREMEDTGCCRCLEPGRCEQTENVFGSSVASLAGATAGMLIGM